MGYSHYMACDRGRLILVLGFTGLGLALADRQNLELNNI